MPSIWLKMAKSSFTDSFLMTLSNGINKDVSSVKQLPTTVLAYTVDCVCFCLLLKTQHCSLYPIMKGISCLRLLTPHPLIHATSDITVAVKKVAQNPAVLALAS